MTNIHHYKAGEMLLKNTRKYSDAVPMICKNKIQYVNNYMQNKSIQIKQVRQNVSLFNGIEVNAYALSNDNDSLLIDIIDSSKYINAAVFIFTLSGTLLQMLPLVKEKTIINLPLLPKGKYIMNIQNGKDVLTWVITKM